MRELKSQIEELMSNLGAQKEKLSQQKLEHETEVSKKNETGVLFCYIVEHFQALLVFCTTFANFTSFSGVCSFLVHRFLQGLFRPGHL